MGYIASPIPSIEALNFEAPLANRVIDIARFVRLRGDNGWLIETTKGKLHVIGRAADRVNKDGIFLDVTADRDSSWGIVLEAAIALKKVTKEELEEHRKVIGERVRQKLGRSYLQGLSQSCERYGLTLADVAAAMKASANA